MTSTRESVAIIATGSANLASVIAAFERLGTDPVVTTDPELVRASAAVVLPGVGHFGEAAGVLTAHGLDQAIRERVNSERPLLAICLGFQLMFVGSDESPGVPGLSLLSGRCERFSQGLRSPQMGWNEVAPQRDGGITTGEAYFANSFRIPSSAWYAASQFIPALTKYDTDEFVSGFSSESGTIVGCQFHPELSGAWGSRLLQRWLETSDISVTEATPC